MTDTPIAGRFIKGTPGTTLAGDMIDSMPADGLDAATKARLLPTPSGAVNGQVPRIVNGRYNLGQVPTPDFDAVIDRLAPNVLRHEEHLTIGDDQAGKHLVSTHFLPTSGDVTLSVVSEPLLFSIAHDSDAIYSFEPKAETVGSHHDRIVGTFVGNLPRTYDLVAYSPTLHKNLGLVNGSHNTDVYEINLSNKTDKLLGPVRGTSNVIGFLITVHGGGWILADDNQRLYRMNMGDRTVSLAGNTRANHHAGIIDGTFCTHVKGGVHYCIANLTANAGIALIEINANTGAPRQIGSPLAFGDASSIVSMTSFRVDGKLELYYFLKTGGCYHIALDVPPFTKHTPVSYTHLTLPTNREV